MEKPALVTVAHFAAHVSRLGARVGDGRAAGLPTTAVQRCKYLAANFPELSNFCASGGNEGRGRVSRSARLRSDRNQEELAWRETRRRREST